MKLQLGINFFDSDPAEPAGANFEISLHPLSSIEDVKRLIHSRNASPLRSQRLFFGPSELSDDLQTITAAGLTNGDTITLAINHRSSRWFSPLIAPYGQSSSLEICREMLRECQGLEASYLPEIIEGGTSGTYCFFSRTGQRCAIFKPEDEEAFAPNNPRGHVGTLGQSGFRNGIPSGRGTLREVAAFVLDHDGFSGVPPTIRVEINARVFLANRRRRTRSTPDLPSARSRSQSPPSLRSHSEKKACMDVKIGSLQRYVEHDADAADYGWTSGVSKEEVHKLGILDIRLLNTDRNETNILVHVDEQTKRKRLTPIDHGLCIPSTLELAWCDWEWLDWPACKMSFSQTTKDYVLGLDIDADVMKLRKELGINELALANIRIAGKFLQKGVAQGLNLHQIATIISRADLDSPSQLEIMCAQAEAYAHDVVKRNPSITREILSRRRHKTAPFPITPKKRVTKTASMFLSRSNPGPGLLHIPTSPRSSELKMSPSPQRSPKSWNPLLKRRSVNRRVDSLSNEHKTRMHRSHSGIALLSLDDERPKLASPYSLSKHKTSILDGSSLKKTKLSQPVENDDPNINALCLDTFVSAHGSKKPPSPVHAHRMSSLGETVKDCAFNRMLASLQQIHLPSVHDGSDFDGAKKLLWT